MSSDSKRPCKCLKNFDSPSLLALAHVDLVEFSRDLLITSSNRTSTVHITRVRCVTKQNGKITFLRKQFHFHQDQTWPKGQHKRESSKLPNNISTSRKLLYETFITTEENRDIWWIRNPMRKGNFTEEFAFVGEIMISLRLGNGWGHDHQHNEAHDRHSPRENCAFPHFHASELRETER